MPMLSPRMLGVPMSRPSTRAISASDKAAELAVKISHSLIGLLFELQARADRRSRALKLASYGLRHQLIAGPEKLKGSGLLSLQSRHPSAVHGFCRLNGADPARASRLLSKLSTRRFELLETRRVKNALLSLTKRSSARSRKRLSKGTHISR